MGGDTFFDDILSQFLLFMGVTLWWYVQRKNKQNTNNPKNKSLRKSIRI